MAGALLQACSIFSLVKLVLSLIFIYICYASYKKLALGRIGTERVIESTSVVDLPSITICPAMDILNHANWKDYNSVQEMFEDIRLKGMRGIVAVRDASVSK